MPIWPWPMRAVSIRTLQVIRIWATSGEGMDEWLDWIRAGCKKAVDRKMIDGR